MSPSIVRCQLTDSASLTGVVRRAFAENPMIRWIAEPMGADVDRTALFHAYFAIFVEHGLRRGEVEATADGAAVAVWFRPDSGAPEDYDARLAEIAGPHLERFALLDDAMHHAHPEGEQHHLAFLATEPGVQSSGLGSALLRHRHAVLDERGQQAYLEASAPRNRALYERHGYRLTGASIEVGSGMWPMIRPPGAAEKPGSVPG